MYASVRHYKIGAGSIASLIGRIDAEFAPTLKQEAGFVGYFALETGEETVQTISIFQDRASAERSSELAADYVRDNLGEFQLERTGRTVGEVLVSRVTPKMLDDSHPSGAERALQRSAAGREMFPGAVLVVGATGRTGRLIVARLVERGIRVHALVRDRAKAHEVLPSKAVQFVGDVRRAETLTEPIAGVRAVIIATAGSAQHDNAAEIVDYHGTRNVVEQAAAAKLDLVIFISSIYASRQEHYQDVEPTSLGWKARAEEIIRNSPVPYCIVRPGWLTDADGGAPLTVAQGDTAEGQISRTDLADVCTQLLSLADARGKTFEVIAAHDPDPAASFPSAVTTLKPDSALLQPH